ncbi:hypothetical protein MASR2M36_39250 [Providencia sp.]
MSISFLIMIIINLKLMFQAQITFIEKDASVNEHIEQMRLSATKALLERRDVIVVASVSAIYGLGDPDSYLKMMLPHRWHDHRSAFDFTPFG